MTENAGIENVAALNELNMASEGVERGETNVDSPLLSLASGQDTAFENTDGQGDDIADASQHSDLLFSTAQRSDSRIRSVVHGLLKPLLAVATAQYALVTAIAGLTAYSVASNASKLINTSLEPIIAALKRL